jgi:hypothetical protein
MTTTNTSATAALVRQALQHLMDTGQVVELRALDVSTPKIRRAHTVSGYFNDMDQLAQAASKVDRYAKGVYITLNQIKPSLLARAANRVRAIERNDTLTADHDVERRRWLPVDCDPVRPKGIAATEAEHQAGCQRAAAIREALRGEGWPDPIQADAGNSGHLLYAIDLPNDDASRTLIEHCLEALAWRFDDEVVHVDQAVFNAARIWRLYGTWNHKGDDVPERPHRLASLVEIPGARVCVPLGHLQTLAQARPQREQASYHQRTNGRVFDIERWITEHQLELDGPLSWKDGRKWVFPVCPWDATHTNRSAFIVQLPSGAVEAGCHHNGCHRKDWHALRDLLEPARERTSRNGQHADERTATDPHHPQDDMPQWPILDPKALDGLAGEVVRVIGPHTEADDVALLVQILLAFGNVIGRKPHCVAEADYHALNEFAVLVGTTAKGRKGSSAGHVRRLFGRVDRVWTEDRIQGGLSSGEGLVWAVRDPIVKSEAIREKGRPTGEYQEVTVDVGVSDKRLLILEAELAATLRVLSRDGNTLSAIVRQAWDDGRLRILTKNTPAQATGAHISLVGHITRDELLRYLDSIEAGNGYGNRHLWCCVRRSKTLPEGGSLDDAALNDLVKRLRRAIDAAARVDVITRDEDARAIWREVYPELSEGKPGLLGAMTSRGEAHVMRLSAIYALLDCSPIVKSQHLLAALALWEYCEESARFIFGASLGDPVADEILRLLRTNNQGLTRTEISNHFGRNKSSAQITRALQVLVEQGLAMSEKQGTEGRTAEVWKVIGTTN